MPAGTGSSLDEPGSTLMPTGIASLDPVIEGGVPPGSVILLLSDIGAGSTEFVYSSILNLAIRSEDPAGSRDPHPVIRYVTLTRKKEDIIQEITLSFQPALVRGLAHVTFEDLSALYFDARMVPLEWYSRGDLIAHLQQKHGQRNLLADIAARVHTGERHGLIVIDSLTDIAAQYAGTPNWNELTAFLRGLQRVSKEWNSTLYILLTRGILDPQKEREIADTADAVLLFRWEETTAARRQRIMYFEKFRGLMPHLEEKDLVKFAVRISSGGGFEVENIRVVI